VPISEMGVKKIVNFGIGENVTKRISEAKKEITPGMNTLYLTAT
jgi:hypothetical protein